MKVDDDAGLDTKIVRKKVVCLLRFLDFLKKQTLTSAVVGIEWKPVVWIFLRIGNIFGETDPLNRPQLTILRDRTDKKIPRLTSQDVVAEFDVKTVNHDLDDELPLCM